MNLLENLSDDQLALLWSALAIVFCFALLVVMPGLRHRATQLTKPKTQPQPRFHSRNKRVPTH
jgi:hypothetical protein